MPSNEEELNWIKSIAKGSESALKLVYDCYSTRVFNTVLSYTKNREDAEEIHQDVFVTVFNSAHTFRHDASLKTWIYRIAINKSLDHLRKKNSQKRKGFFVSLYNKEDGAPIFEPIDFEHPGIQLENMESSKILFRAIDELSENQRTAFILTQIEDLPQKEVAQIMDCSRKAVESLLQRAKANLKKELEKYNPERGNSTIKTSNKV